MDFGVLKEGRVKFIYEVKTHRNEGRLNNLNQALDFIWRNSPVPTGDQILFKVQGETGTYIAERDLMAFLVLLREPNFANIPTLAPHMERILYWRTILHDQNFKINDNALKDSLNSDYDFEIEDMTRESR